MEAAIDEPLGDVVDRYSGAFVQRPRIDDAFVRDAPLPACVDHGVGAREALRDVIGAEDCDTRRLGESSPTHHETIAPRDRQDRCRAIRCRRYRQRTAARLGMSWKERREMRLYADWPHAGAATPMGDAERLMQIEVAYVCANVAWPCQSHERIHVGAVEIHLATVCVRDRADLVHRLLEYAVGRWVRNHACR